MTGEEIEAIVGGYHGDAFRILGPHAGETGWEVRAWLPQAQSVTVVHDSARAEMKKKHDLGFFTAKIEPNIFPELQRLIAALQRDGVEIWAVSSTNDWVIEEGVRRFNIPASRVLAARVQVLNGIVTENLLDVPTDEGKVAALARAGITCPDCVFGNSVHDAAMLAIARRAFPVNPTPALVERSAHEGWPIFFPASVKPV